MAPRISKGRRDAFSEYKTASENKPVAVRTKVRLNFIEAQRQILDKSRQNKAATGIVMGLLISLIIWALLVKFVL